MTNSRRDEALIGQLIAGRYEVRRLLGKGGMGAVYQVRHCKLGRDFAMKSLTGDMAGNPEAILRFRREADAMARLRHPNVVDVVDWETLDDGSPCMIIELLKGEDLAARIDRGPLDWPVIGRIGDEILSALEAAHRAGIVHRDLKPQNIFLAIDDSGQEYAKLLDFGVSKMHDAANMVTTSDRLIGTPAYMSPEQARGQSELVGPATDVWAMGAILYEMASGEPPFAAPTVPALMYQICHGAIQPLPERRPDVPHEFCELIERVLSRDPERRLTEAAALRRSLRDALDDFVSFTPLPEPRLMAPITPAPGEEPRRPPTGVTREHPIVEAIPPTIEHARPSRRPRWLVVVAAVSLAALAVVAYVRRPSRQPATAPTTLPASTPAGSNGEPRIVQPVPVVPVVPAPSRAVSPAPKRRANAAKWSPRAEEPAAEVAQPPPPPAAPPPIVPIDP